MTHSAYGRVEIDLNPWKHGVADAFPTAGSYQQVCQKYVKELHVRLSTVEDAITGNTLTLAEQACLRPRSALRPACSPGGTCLGLG